MVWRCRNSAVANRRALHPDYTSATKKTPSPLNGRCTRAQNGPCFAQVASCLIDARSADTQHRRASRRELIDTLKTLIRPMFSRMSGIQFRFRAREENCVLSTTARSQTAGAVSVLPRPKIFSTDALFRPLRDGACNQKRANRAPSDSRFSIRVPLCASQ